MGVTASERDLPRRCILQRFTGSNIQKRCHVDIAICRA
jgi:hypothetical protein